MCDEALCSTFLSASIIRRFQISLCIVSPVTAGRGRSRFSKDLDHSNNSFGMFCCWQEGIQGSLLRKTEFPVIGCPPGLVAYDGSRMIEYNSSVYPLNIIQPTSHGQRGMLQVQATRLHLKLHNLGLPLKVPSPCMFELVLCRIDLTNGCIL